MDEYLSEKEQIEQIRKWWAENGRFVITGLVIGLGLLFGWRGWVQYREAHLGQASSGYTALLEAVEQGDRERALSLAAQIESEFANTPYATQAALALARLHVEADQPEDAALRLEQVIRESADEELTQVARLRLARVRLYQQKAQQALDVLAVGDPGRFAPLFEEVRGDALTALGKAEEARAAYERALQGVDPGQADASVIEMKLNDLPALDAGTPIASDEAP